MKRILAWFARHVRETNESNLDYLDYIDANPPTCPVITKPLEK